MGRILQESHRGQMLNEKVDFESSELMILKSENIIEYPFHKHENAYEIILVLKGEIDLYLVNAHEIMTAGDVQICNPNELHYLKGLTDDNVVLFLYINADDSVSNIQNFRSYIFTTRNIDKSNEALHKLRANIRDIAEKFYEDKLRKSEVEEEIRTIINILIEDFQFYFIPSNYKFRATEVFKKNEIQISRIRRANDYIYDNYNKQIKLEDLAEIENITPQYLTYILKRGGGIGFRKLLNMARVEKASHFLLNSEKSLQSISYECGFSKYEYFNNTFKKFSDLTPSQFREKYKSLTIINKTPQFKILDKNLVLGLLKGMRSNNRGISIGLKGIKKGGIFHKDISATLDLKNYNHLALFNLVKTAADEISLKNVLLDGLFIAGRKHTWDNLTRIINDLMDIHLSIYITVDADISPKKYELLIRFINEYTEKTERAITLVVYEIETRGENIDKLLDIAADNHVEVVLCKKQVLNETLFSGLPLSYTLDLINNCDESYSQPYTLFSEKSSGRENEIIELALLEKSGLKLPSYHTCSMIKKMGKYFIQKTKDYYVTTNETKSDIHFLFYNFDEEYIKSAENELKDGDNLKVNIGDDRMQHIVDYDVNITGLDGLYAIREYRFRDDDYNKRFDPGFDLSRLSSDCMNIFNESLEPSKSIKFIKSKNNHDFSFSLIPFEILFLSIEKI